ncbi:hypothetical protein PLICRDRAFT_199460 [Plicaturopsis crispa FD-325 SS-3]|nr:hypothetical protein PLICRDRAFT_199460 [Plicaturopsis crispa FD-325 SS-3]
MHAPLALDFFIFRFLDVRRPRYVARTESEARRASRLLLSRRRTLPSPCLSIFDFSASGEPLQSILRARPAGPRDYFPRLRACSPTVNFRFFDFWKSGDRCTCSVLRARPVGPRDYFSFVHTSSPALDFFIFRFSDVRRQLYIARTESEARRASRLLLSRPRVLPGPRHFVFRFFDVPRAPVPHLESEARRASRLCFSRNHSHVPQVLDNVFRFFDVRPPLYKDFIESEARRASVRLLSRPCMLLSPSTFSFSIFRRPASVPTTSTSGDVDRCP